jgi:hypothetical protein
MGEGEKTISGLHKTLSPFSLWEKGRDEGLARRNHHNNFWFYYSQIVSLY